MRSSDTPRLATGPFAASRVGDFGRPSELVAWLAVLALGALAPCALADEASRGYAPELGVPHPEIRLRTITDGRVVSLSDFRGKKVLLLHFASW